MVRVGCMYAWMDGWMDGWMDVQYVFMHVSYGCTVCMYILR